MEKNNSLWFSIIITKKTEALLPSCQLLAAQSGALSDKPKLRRSLHSCRSRNCTVSWLPFYYRIPYWRGKWTPGDLAWVPFNLFQNTPPPRETFDAYSKTETWVNIFQLYGLNLKGLKAQEPLAVWIRPSVHRNHLNSSLQQCSAVLRYASSHVMLQWQLWTLFHDISWAEANKPVVSTLEGSLCFGCWGCWSDSSQCRSGLLYTIRWLTSRSQFAFDPISWVN